MEGTNSSGESAFRQSGVLIAPNFVLTSVHGLLETNNDLSSIYQDVQFGFGSNYFTDRQQVQSPSEIFFHPSYQDIGSGFDLALLYFDNPFSNITPANRYAGDKSDLVGQDAYTAGFGITGNNETGPVLIDGNKRAGVNADISNRALVTTNNFQTTTFRAPGATFGRFRELGIGFSAGDSGGFWGIEENGELVLTGINSILSGDGTYGSFNRATDIDNSFINPIIESKSVAVAEPSFLAAFFIGGIFLLIRRKHPHRRSAKFECVDGNGIKSLA